MDRHALGMVGVGTPSDIQGGRSVHADVAGFLLRLDEVGSRGMDEVQSYGLGGGRREFGQRESLCQSTKTRRERFWAAGTSGCLPRELSPRSRRVCRLRLSSPLYENDVSSWQLVSYVRSLSPVRPQSLQSASRGLMPGSPPGPVAPRGRGW